MKQKLTYIHTLSDLYTLLGSVILSLCISLSLNDFFSLSNSPVFFILFTFLFIFLFRFIADNHNKIMAYFILISFFSLLYIFATSMGFITKNLFQNTLSYALGTYTGEDVAQYALFYVFIISSLISFCAYFLYKIERIRPFLHFPFSLCWCLLLFTKQI